MERYGNGPFYLGGWCADGITAYETARVIEERQGKVGLLVLIDAINPECYTDTGSLMRSAANTVGTLKGALTDGFRKGFSAMAETMTPLMKRARDRMATIQQYRFDRNTSSFPVLVLRPAEIPVEEEDLGWSRSCKGTIYVVEVPGEHDSVFREPDFLGRQLRTYLDVEMRHNVSAISDEQIPDAPDSSLLKPKVA
jgi:thioesterase domain-containing protein